MNADDYVLATGMTTRMRHVVRRWGTTPSMLVMGSQDYDTDVHRRALCGSITEFEDAESTDNPDECCFRCFHTAFARDLVDDPAPFTEEDMASHKRPVTDGGQTPDSMLPAWAERTEEGRIRCTVCENEADELPVDHDCIYQNDLVADGGQTAEAVGCYLVRYDDGETRYFSSLYPAVAEDFEDATVTIVTWYVASRPDLVRTDGGAAVPMVRESNGAVEYVFGPDPDAYHAWECERGER